MHAWGPARAGRGTAALRKAITGARPSGQQESASVMRASSSSSAQLPCPRLPRASAQQPKPRFQHWEASVSRSSRAAMSLAFIHCWTAGGPIHCSRVHRALQHHLRPNDQAVRVCGPLQAPKFDSEGQFRRARVTSFFFKEEFSSARGKLSKRAIKIHLNKVHKMCAQIQNSGEASFSGSARRWSDVLGAQHVRGEHVVL